MERSMTHYHRISLLFTCKENNMSVDQPSAAALEGEREPATTSSEFHV